MPLDELEDALLCFLRDELFVGDDIRLDVTTPLLESGVLNSIDVMYLVGFVEEHYSVEIPSELLTPDALATLSSFAALIRRLQ
jgi:acyl carrier protein